MQTKKLSPLFPSVSVAIDKLGRQSAPCPHSFIAVATHILDELPRRKSFG